MAFNKKQLLQLYPSYTTVLGPYERKDGRKHIILNNANAAKGEKGKTKTISYPKALVESNIGRKLLPNETIDHNDRDKTNDDYKNLIIRDRSEHSKLDARHVVVDSVSCVECGTLFQPSRSQRNSQAVIGEEEPAGPFCSRKCVGNYGARVQNGGKKLERQEIVKTYILPKK